MTEKNKFTDRSTTKSKTLHSFQSAHALFGALKGSETFSQGRDFEKIGKKLCETLKNVWLAAD